MGTGRFFRRVVVSVVVLAAAVPAATTTATAATRVSNAPVVFVHGFLLNTCPGTNPNSTFAGAVTALKASGHTGPNDMINYYACDSKGSNIQKSGDPKAYFSTGQYVTGGNTNETDIRHISYQLAWYLYDTYASKGKTVELVGHSMGGLIIRWALQQIQVRNPVFPPVLYVQDAVTISAPHLGLKDNTNNVTWCPSSLQCRQMLPGSSFLNELNTVGNPQATGGTDWTVIGGGACDFVTAAQATGAGDVHKVIYPSKKPVCYNHTSYLTDTSAAADMPVQTRHPGEASLAAGTGMHSMRWMASAVMSGSR